MHSSSSDPAVCSILDIPDEILVKIILHFNARKRLALAHSCKRFHSLVFGDGELLRELDFSKNGRLTTPTDIYRYFGDEESRKHVRRVNIQNVICMGPGLKMLNDTIGKSTNLVDVNIRGIEFRDIKELGKFLEPLIHVKRLSIDWPKMVKDNAAICEQVLQKRFSKLSYLSTEVDDNLKIFLSLAQMCEELEELRIVSILSDTEEAKSRSWILKPNKNKNLKIFQFRGPNSRYIRKTLHAMLADLREWTEFQGINIFHKGGYYYEKNLEICDELRNTEWMKSIPYNDSEPGLVLDYDSLLSEVIKLNHEDIPESFCCLGQKYLDDENQMMTEYMCMLKVDEAKRLLKNPRYQISYFQHNHSIEPHCDAHLFISAFKNLTELALRPVSQKDFMDWGNDIHFRRRLREKDCSTPEGPDDPTNSDSPFAMLIENTPNVEDLTIDSSYRNGRWDLEALRLIARWTNLRALRLAYIELTDAEFLIEIGKQCPKLEILNLYALMKYSDKCYSSDLSRMLTHCRSLKEFSIEETKIDKVPEIFVSLSCNTNLRKVYLKTTSKTSLSIELMSSIELLLRNCVKLYSFVCKMNWVNKNDSDQLASALRRIRGELNRPKFQFQLCEDSEEMQETVHNDAMTSFFSYKSHWSLMSRHY